MIIDELLKVLDQHGGERYGGEAINQRQHGLQCATLAERDGCSDSLISAALLHDVGHLIHHLGEHCADQGIDDAHEHRAEKLLTEHFIPAVVQPIRLHVDAKRYLCFAEAGYWDSLSPASKQSLELQGGPFTAEQAASFEQHEFFNDAVQLRRYDDLGKDPEMTTPELSHFRSFLHTCLLPARTA